MSSRKTTLAFTSPANTSLDELLGLRSAAVALQRKALRKSAAPLDGSSVSRRLGRGLDFAEVREYQPGDDVRMIDWKVTARSGKAHTKLFVEERERPVLLLVDCRASMRFATRGMYKSVMAARLAALLGWCAVTAHDRVGGFVFSDDWHSEIRPQSGRRGLMALFRAVHECQLRDSGTGQKQLVKTLTRLRHGAHSGSTVVLMSDFHDFDDEARKSLGSASHAMDMVAVQLNDPLDFTLPAPGTYPVSTPARQRLQLSIGAGSERLRYAQDFLLRQQELRQFFVQQRHAFIGASTHEPLLDVASRILSRQTLAKAEQEQASS